MTKEQLFEAQELFEASLDPSYRDRLNRCLQDILSVSEAHGEGVFNDTLLRMNEKLIGEADKRGDSLRGMWVIGEPGES